MAARMKFSRRTALTILIAAGVAGDALGAKPPW